MEASIAFLYRLLSERGRCALRQRRSRVLPSRTSAARWARGSMPSSLGRRGRGFKVGLEKRHISSRRPGRLHRRGVEQRGSLKERVWQEIPLLRLRHRWNYVGQEKLTSLHCNEGSAGDHAGSQIAAGLRERLLQLWDDRVVFRK